MRWILTPAGGFPFSLIKVKSTFQWCSQGRNHWDRRYTRWTRSHFCDPAFAATVFALPNSKISKPSPLILSTSPLKNIRIYWKLKLLQTKRIFHDYAWAQPCGVHSAESAFCQSLVRTYRTRLRKTLRNRNSVSGCLRLDFPNFP